MAVPASVLTASTARALASTPSVSKRTICASKLRTPVPQPASPPAIGSSPSTTAPTAAPTNSRSTTLTAEEPPSLSRQVLPVIHSTSMMAAGSAWASPLQLPTSTSRAATRPPCVWSRTARADSPSPNLGRSWQRSQLLHPRRHQRQLCLRLKCRYRVDIGIRRQRNYSERSQRTRKYLQGRRGIQDRPSARSRRKVLVPLLRRKPRHDERLQRECRTRRERRSLGGAAGLFRGPRALNHDFRYQLTPIAAPAPSLFVAKRIQDNRFKISGGPARGLVSWQVPGVR